MQKTRLYIKDWLAIHPYNRQQPSDSYFMELANRLYAACPLDDIQETSKKKLCLYTAAYFEDVISGTGLWQAFIRKHTELYGTPLPFYPVRPGYAEDEVNEEDIRFIIWNTLQKALPAHSYLNPLNAGIEKAASLFFGIVEDEYETAPANDLLQDFFRTAADKEDACRKLSWLFGGTYLTAPSVQEYIDRITPSDRFDIPCGPLALYLHEWIDLLAHRATEGWRCIEELYPALPEEHEEARQRNERTYALFTAGTGNKPVAYLNGYGELHRFLTGVLHWQDDEDHTLPQMKGHRNFVMMANPEKGILLAKDICECISDPLNPMYAPEVASEEAFSLLTVPTLCRVSRKSVGISIEVSNTE